MTTAATARTRRRPPAATTTSRPRAAAAVRQRSAASRRGPASRPTRRCWSTQAAARPAASRPTASRPSTRPSPTASTSSTTRSAARTTNFLDAVEIAFLFAADAGVFVAASAGNSGPTTAHGRASRPVADHGRGRHPQPRRPGLGHARQRRDLQRRLRCASARSAPLIDVDGRRRSPAPIRRSSRCASTAVDNGGDADARSGEGRRQDRASAIAASPPRSTRAWRCRRPAASGMMLVNTTHELDQRRLPLRPDRARPGTRSCRRQGLRGDAGRDRDDQRRRRSSTTPRRRSRPRSRRAARCARAAATCSSRT